MNQYIRNRRSHKLEPTTLLGANPRASSIGISRGDGTMVNVMTNTASTTTYSSIEDLAFLYWQFHANEKAYAAKLITTAMYEYARDELQKTIEKLS